MIKPTSHNKKVVAISQSPSKIKFEGTQQILKLIIRGASYNNKSPRIPETRNVKYLTTRFNDFDGYTVIGHKNEDDSLIRGIACHYTGRAIRFESIADGTYEGGRVSWALPYELNIRRSSRMSNQKEVKENEWIAEGKGEWIYEWGDDNQFLRLSRDYKNGRPEGPLIVETQMTDHTKYQWDIALKPESNQSFNPSETPIGRLINWSEGSKRSTFTFENCHHRTILEIEKKDETFTVLTCYTQDYRETDWITQGTARQKICIKNKPSFSVLAHSQQGEWDPIITIQGTPIWIGAYKKNIPLSDLIQILPKKEERSAESDWIISPAFSGTISSTDDKWEKSNNGYLYTHKKGKKTERYTIEKDGKVTMIQNTEGRTGYSLAILRKDIDYFKRLINEEPKHFNTPEKDGVIPIFYLLGYWSLNDFLSVLSTTENYPNIFTKDNGFDVNQVDGPSQLTPIQMAVQFQKNDWLEWLCEHFKVDLEKKFPIDKVNVFEYAAEKGDERTCQFLLNIHPTFAIQSLSVSTFESQYNQYSKGLDFFFTDTEDVQGDTSEKMWPLKNAIKHGKNDWVDWLCEHYKKNFESNELDKLYFLIEYAYSEEKGTILCALLKHFPQFTRKTLNMVQETGEFKIIYPLLQLYLKDELSACEEILTKIRNQDSPKNDDALKNVSGSASQTLKKKLTTVQLEKGKIKDYQVSLKRNITKVESSLLQFINNVAVAHKNTKARLDKNTKLTRQQRRQLLALF